MRLNLRRSLQSVVDQTVRPLDLIVVDDCEPNDGVIEAARGQGVDLRFVGLTEMLARLPPETSALNSRAAKF